MSTSGRGSSGIITTNTDNMWLELTAVKPQWLMVQLTQQTSDGAPLRRVKSLPDAWLGVHLDGKEVTCIGEAERCCPIPKLSPGGQLCIRQADLHGLPNGLYCFALYSRHKKVAQTYLIRYHLNHFLNEIHDGEGSPPSTIEQLGGHYSYGGGASRGKSACRNGRKQPANGRKQSPAVAKRSAPPVPRPRFNAAAAPVPRPRFNGAAAPRQPEYEEEEEEDDDDDDDDGGGELIGVEVAEDEERGEERDDGDDEDDGEEGGEGDEGDEAMGYGEAAMGYGDADEAEEDEEADDYDDDDVDDDDDDDDDDEDEESDEDGGEEEDEDGGEDGGEEALPEIAAAIGLDAAADRDVEAARGDDEMVDAA